MPPKLLLKSLAAGCCQNLGVFDFLRSRRLVERGFVLTYHRVLDGKRSGAWVEPGMYVSTATFSRHVEALKQAFRVLPLSELLERVASGRSVGGCCALTFDDGWLDNYQEAYPILRQHQLPATIFLATGFIGTTRPFWPEELAHYLRHPDGLVVAKLCPALQRLVKDAPEGRLECLLPQVVAALKRLARSEREAFLDRLRSVCAPPCDRLLMNWQEAAAMRASGLIEFGAHTVNHVMLDEVSLQQATDEVAGARRDLQRHLELTPELFSYPNGNIPQQLEPVLRKQGFKGAVTTRKGWLCAATSLYRIPRIGMHEDVSRTLPLFMARILLERY